MQEVSRDLVVNSHSKKKQALLVTILSISSYCFVWYYFFLDGVENLNYLLVSSMYSVLQSIIAVTYQQHPAKLIWIMPNKQQISVLVSFDITWLPYVWNIASAIAKTYFDVCFYLNLHRIALKTLFHFYDSLYELIFTAQHFLLWTKSLKNARIFKPLTGLILVFLCLPYHI